MGDEKAGTSGSSKTGENVTPPPTTPMNQAMADALKNTLDGISKVDSKEKKNKRLTAAEKKKILAEQKEKEKEEKKKRTREEKKMGEMSSEDDDGEESDESKSKRIKFANQPAIGFIVYK